MHDASREAAKDDPVSGVAPKLDAASELKTAYKLFVLAVLVAANVLNYADRAVLGALAGPIKHDLGMTDAQLGFMAGTSFVLFNAIVGIAMGGVGDRWRRNRLLMFGVGLWSGMTMLSGAATSYVQLVLARIGVGVGEATIGSVGYSMLADVFTARRRGLVFSIFLCGPFIGISLSLALGGWLVQNWPGQCGVGLCALKGWQAAFIVFGLPGLVVAALALLVGEPVQEKIALSAGKAKPFAEGVHELSLLVPPFATFQIWRLGGARAGTINLAAGAAVAMVAVLLVWLTGSVAQWLAVGVAAYGLISWCQAQPYRDPAFCRLTVGSPIFWAVIFGGAMVAALHGTMSFWSIPFATRQFGMSYAEAGGSLGAAIGGGSLLGTLIGGFAADRWRRVDRAAPLYIAAICAGAGAILLTVILTAGNKVEFVLATAALMVFLGAWPAGVTALMQDLVLPMMRARAAALYVCCLTLIAGSTGPYAVGRIADLTGSIRTGLSCLYILVPGSILLLLFAVRRLPAAYLERDLLQARQRTT
ncbi:MFS transporter [Phenylobacterium sp.]|jgi:MFS family permease|uniref:MFS transporter n=1 Tax=Phenylobacterium sp. TaxID=1871053 RepID=UPI002F3E8C56